MTTGSMCPQPTRATVVSRGGTTRIQVVARAIGCWVGLVLAVIGWCTGLAVAAPGDVSVFAGNGFFAYSGDGGPAMNASFWDPLGVAVDGGSVVIADLGNHVLRRVDPSGTITTIAGTGVAGFSGDGGPATAAMLSSPHALTVDAAGSLYFADGLRVRKVDRSGIISTVAGSGRSSCCSNSIGDGDWAYSAILDSPSGVAVDPVGNVYISDSLQHRVRKVDRTGIITTFAGTGTAGFNGDGQPASTAQLSSPLGIDVDGSGRLYIADDDNNRVRVVDTSGAISTVAGNGVAGYSGDGGQASSAALNHPFDVKVGGDGAIYVADRGNARVRKVNATGVIATLDSTLDPYAIAVDVSGNVYVGSFLYNRVYRIEGAGSPPIAVPEAPAPVLLSIAAVAMVIVAGATRPSRRRKATP